MSSIDDLPALTDDLQKAAADLERCGLALIANALSSDDVAAALRATDRLAAAEANSGTATFDGAPRTPENPRGAGGPNQRIWSLVGKGRLYRDLLLRPGPLDLIRGAFARSYQYEGAVFGSDVEDVLVSSFTANIAGRGGVPMMLHTDQMYAPLTTPYPVVINVMWMLTDFTEDNGATRVVPGSHRLDDPVRYIREDGRTVAAEAPAGTALVFDGRLIHGTGANRTDKRRFGLLSYYCRPFIRQQENYMLTLNQETIDDCPEELLAMLGFKVWNTLGMLGGSPHGTLTHRHPVNRT